MRPAGLLVLAVVLIGFLYTIPVQIAIPSSHLRTDLRLWALGGLEDYQEGPSCRSTGHFVWQQAHRTSRARGFRPWRMMDWRPRFTGLLIPARLAASEVAPNLLSCPSCRRLVHADRLKELAETAEAAERDGELAPAHGVLARCADLAATRDPSARGHRRPDQPARPSGGSRSIALRLRLDSQGRRRPRPIPPILHAGPVERSRESSARWRSPSGSSSSRPSCCWARRSSSCWG